MGCGKTTAKEAHVPESQEPQKPQEPQKSQEAKNSNYKSIASLYVKNESAETKLNPKNYFEVPKQLKVLGNSLQVETNSEDWLHLVFKARVANKLYLQIEITQGEKVFIGGVAKEDLRGMGTKKLDQESGLRVYTYDASGLVHSQFGSFSYSQFLWKANQGEVMGAEFLGQEINFYKNQRKIYTHDFEEEVVPVVSLCGLGTAVKLVGLSN